MGAVAAVAVGGNRKRRAVGQLTKRTQPSGDRSVVSFDAGPELFATLGEHVATERKDFLRVHGREPSNREVSRSVLARLLCVWGLDLYVLRLESPELDAALTDRNALREILAAGLKAKRGKR